MIPYVRPTNMIIGYHCYEPRFYDAKNKAHKDPSYQSLLQTLSLDLRYTSFAVCINVWKVIIRGSFSSLFYNTIFSYLCMIMNKQLFQVSNATSVNNRASSICTCGYDRGIKGWTRKKNFLQCFSSKLNVKHNIGIT